MVREYNTYCIRDLNCYGQRTRRSAWRWICRAGRCCSGCAAGFERVPPSLGRPAPSTERAFLRSLRPDPKSKISDSNEAQTSDESPPMWAQCHTPRGPRFAPKPERAVAVRALDLRQWSRRRSAAWALQGRCWPRLLLRVRLWPRMPFRIRLVLGEGRRIRILMPVSGASPPRQMPTVSPVSRGAASPIRMLSVLGANGRRHRLRCARRQVTS